MIMPPTDNGSSGEDARKLQALQHEVAEFLDAVAVRTAASFTVAQQLRARADEWKAAGGSAEGQALLRKAQGVVGIVNASPEGDPVRTRALSELLTLKLELRILAAAGWD